jgi:hypothetical protein
MTFSSSLYVRVNIFSICTICQTEKKNIEYEVRVFYIFIPLALL